MNAPARADRGPTVPFLRSPRTYPAAPRPEVVIQAPPALPSAPATNIVPMLLPLGATVVVIILMLMLSSGSSPMMLFTLPLLAVASLGGLYTYFFQRRKHRRSLAAREAGYRAYLQTAEQDLAECVHAQRAAALAAHPAADIWLARAEARAPELWERSRIDTDFLELRLGLGSLPPVFTVKGPGPQSIGAAPDPLHTAALDLAAEGATIDGCPVTMPLGSSGAAGLTGVGPIRSACARGWLIELVAAHAPTDVRLSLIVSEAERAEWHWARWLPHVQREDRTRRIATGIPAASALLAEIVDDLRHTTAQSGATGGFSVRLESGAVHVVVVADPALADWRALSELLAFNTDRVRVAVVFLADRPDQVPADCRVVASLLSSGRGARLRLIGPPTQEFEFVPDQVAPGLAEQAVRALAPIALVGAGGGAAFQLPGLVPLLEVVNPSAEDIQQYWQAPHPLKSLAAPIGILAGGQVLSLDLHERGHGPHMLLGGTTGSGKSELLQTLIVSLAAHFHPCDLSFLLVDFKGGGMANIFSSLPHLQGVISNLDGSQAQRALITLRAELKRRQSLFAQAEVTHIDDYQLRFHEGRIATPIPRLFLLVDEFAELVAQQPEFIKELVSTARVGRSLGVHLILATQKPSGVVSDQIWANTRAKLALKMGDAADSQEILHRPDAAAIRQPGRAILLVGNNELMETFQSGYGGAPYRPAQEAEGRRAFYGVDLTGRRERLWPPAGDDQDRDQTQLVALIERIGAAAAASQVAPLPPIWLAPLSDRIALSDLPPAPDEWLAPTVGLVDDPVHQRQLPLTLPLGRAGHLLIYGGPASGKTTLLQTLVMALAARYRPSEVQFYGLDYGRRQLKLLEVLPHVGSILLPDDTERLHRLLGSLDRELDRRKSVLSQAGAASFVAYRALPGVAALPALILLIDNYPELAAQHPEVFEPLLRLTREGAGLGLHVVATGLGGTSIAYRLADNCALNLALELNDPTEYTSIVGRTGGYFPPRGIKGRGLVRGEPPMEFQAALPAPGETEIELAVALKDALADLARQAPPDERARPVASRPEVVALSDLLSDHGDWSDTAPDLSAPLGLDLASLEPRRVTLSRAQPHLVVMGGGGSGKTTLLQSLLLALAEQHAPGQLQLYLSGLARPTGLLPLTRLPHAIGHAASETELAGLLGHLRGLLAERRAALDQALAKAGGVLNEGEFMEARYPALVVGLDDFEALPSGARPVVEELVRTGAGLRFHLVVTGSPESLAAPMEKTARALRDSQLGVVLGGTDPAVMSNLGIRLAPGSRALAHGQGYYFDRNWVAPVLTVNCQAGALTLPAWVDRLAARLQPVADQTEAA